jgi:hypothetical protein
VSRIKWPALKGINQCPGQVSINGSSSNESQNWFAGDSASKLQSGWQNISGISGDGLLLAIFRGVISILSWPACRSDPALKIKTVQHAGRAELVSASWVGTSVLLKTVLKFQFDSD